MNENVEEIIKEIEKQIPMENISKPCRYILDELLKYAKGENECDITNEEIDKLLLCGQQGNEQYLKIKQAMESPLSNNEKNMKVNHDDNYKKERLRAFLVLKRYLNMITFFHQKTPYKKNSNMIDYYLFDNELKEINNIGLSFYYNIKFWQESNEDRYIYRCEGVDDVKTWEYKNNPKMKDDVITDKREFLKLIFYFITVHIARKFGEENKYKALFCSYSKCFGRDLYHYCYTNNKADVKIVIQAATEINTIQYKTNKNDIKKVSLQEFIWNREIKAEDMSDFQFCISTCDVRNYNNENYNNWSDAYQTLEDTTRPDGEWKKINSIKGTEKLIKKYCEESSLQFNARVRETLGNRIMGTIPDKEIVMSYDYETRKKMKGFEEYNFNRKALLVLTYQYFKRLCEENNWQSLNGKYKFNNEKEFNEILIYNFNVICNNYLINNLEKTKKEKFKHEIHELIKIIANDKLEISINSELENEKYKEYERMINDISSIINQKINWKIELTYMKEIYIDMQNKGNMFVRPNYMYGLSRDMDVVNRLLISGVKMIFYLLVIKGAKDRVPNLREDEDSLVFIIE